MEKEIENQEYIKITVIILFILLVLATDIYVVKIGGTVFKIDDNEKDPEVQIYVIV